MKTKWAVAKEDLKETIAADDHNLTCVCLIRKNRVFIALCSRSSFLFGSHSHYI